MESISAFLGSLSLLRYSELFRCEAIDDVGTLSSMGKELLDDSLAELGVDRGAINAIIEALNFLDEEDDFSVQLEENAAEPHTDESDGSLRLEENDDDGELRLEENDNGEIRLEDNDDGELQLEDDEDGELQLEDNQDGELQLEGNGGLQIEQRLGQDSPPPGIDRYAWELARPPNLPESVLMSTPQVDMLLPASRAPSNPGTDHMQMVGIAGSSRPSKAPLLEALATNGSTLGEGVEASQMPLVFVDCHKLYVFHTSRLLADDRWCEAWAQAGKAQGSGKAQGGGQRRICVLGLGSCMPALAAARAGANVVWVDRVARHVDCMSRIAKRNELRLHVEHSREWEVGGMQGADAFGRRDGFDAVLTEEVDDGLLGDRLLAIASHAHDKLLRPGGVFVPQRAVVFGMLVSVRTTDVNGFDLRGFNAFAAGRSLVSDLEEVQAKERGVVTRLSEPFHICTLGFDSSQAVEETRTGRRLDLLQRANAPGIFNCVVTWYELDLGSGHSLSVGPAAPGGPSSARAHVESGGAAPYTKRGRGQQLHFMGYERQLREGNPVQLVFDQTEASFTITAPLPVPSPEGTLLWPASRSLGYHFPMIADTTRNGCFDRAITNHLRERPAAASHVLDIGSGSGLLAMMAVRAGAKRVSSLDMVPAMAAVATHIVEQNGMCDVVRVQNAKSTDLEPEDLGGLAEMLVCELVDNEFLGEGTLFSIADARRVTCT